MPFKPSEIEHLLQVKFGFERAPGRKRSGHDHYRCVIEGIGVVSTHVSRSDKRDVGDQVLGMIAKELHVRLPFCKGMFACTHSQEDYLAQVKADPYPPFRR